jgi:SAM-dependent methyltransferase
MGNEDRISTRPGKPFERFESKYFSGADLYGDDLNAEGLRRWFAAEENGYYALTTGRGDYGYGYHALNRLLAYRYLKPHYRLCVVLGCAAGDDVLPLAPRVDRFLAIEPAQCWWRKRIGDKPALYVKPSVMGNIPLTEASADLVIALGVLHHIPNVSHVLDEVTRVLKQGGHFVLREPISSMGDWRKPRRGLTANERGLPVKWLEDVLAAKDFVVIRRRFCCFAPLSRLSEKLGIRAPYNRSVLVALDSVLCRLMRWNLHYHRDRLWYKLAPGAVAYVLEKKGRSSDSNNIKR